jgi:hypothetical protein
MPTQPRRRQQADAAAVAPRRPRPRPVVNEGTVQAPDGADIRWMTVNGLLYRADGTGADGVGHHLISVPAAGYMICGSSLLFYEQPVGRPIARVFVWRTFANLANLTWNTQMSGPQFGRQVQATMDYLSRMSVSEAVWSGRIRSAVGIVPLEDGGFAPVPGFQENVALQRGTFTPLRSPQTNISPQSIFPQLATTFSWWQPVLERFGNQAPVDMSLPPIPPSCSRLCRT